jgi:hypothetical protein
VLNSRAGTESSSLGQLDARAAGDCRNPELCFAKEQCGQNLGEKCFSVYPCTQIMVCLSSQGPPPRTQIRLGAPNGVQSATPPAFKQE